MNSIVEKFKNFLGPLSTAQRVLFFGLVVAILIVISTLFYWTLRPSYSILFGSLKQDAAQQITETLDEQGVDYKLKDGGEAIYVKSNRVDQLRLDLAPMGDSQSKMKGYELFDSNSLGMTDYMQQLNNKRALQGELSRSVNTLEQVESSRVHLVLPERSPFESETVNASASVILELNNGETLSNKHVDGIASLVAGSVKGLDAKNVTLVDQEGNRLTSDGDSQGTFASEKSRLKAEKKTESYLTTRGQSMLDRVLGPGNSIVRVSVEQNFDSLVRRSNEIDPGSRTLISEEQSEEVHAEENSEIVPIDEFTPVEERGETAVTSTNEDEVTSRSRNFEVSETNEVYKKEQGEVTNITASVLLNYKNVQTVNDEGQTVWEKQPYTEEEINEFREVLSSAIGIKPDRGDRITIQQVEFWNPNNRPPRNDGIDNPWPWSKVFRWGLILSALAALLWLVNSLRRRYTSDQQMVLSTPFDENQEVFMDEQVDKKIEDMNKQELQKALDNEENEELPAKEEKKYNIEEIVNLVEIKPNKAAKVVRAMLITNDE